MVKDVDFSNALKQDKPVPVYICEKSRTDYLITISGCPFVWRSKFKSTITLDTVDAAYSTLSMSTRELLPLLPLKLLVKETTNELGPQAAYEIKTKSTVFEDSTGCIALANCTIMKPRSKHIAVIYHWFRNHVMRGETAIVKIDTTEQLADVATKALPITQPCILRDKIMNWESKRN
jgi:hypothetical protein